MTNTNSNPTTNTTLPWDNIPDGCYYIGRLGMPHGVKGEMTFNVADDVFDRMDADYIIVEADGLPVPFFIESYRWRSETVALIKLEGIDTETAARHLAHHGVFFPRSMADTQEDVLSWNELVGYTVVSADSGQTVGQVQRVEDTTINILIEVDGHLLPISEELVEDISKKEHTIKLHIPDGLLEL